jgi:PAS domain S-box-containing protein
MGAERARILVVDDRRENLLALEASLADGDYDLELVHGGEAALSALLKHDFALILLDVAMPGMDGFETAELIRQRQRSRHIPIIFVTANMPDTKSIFRGYEGGAVDYLVKPHDPHALQSKVAVLAELWVTAREKERAEAALAEAERAARKLAEALYDVTFREAPIGIAHVSSDIKWLRLNQRMASMLGFQPNELEGRNFLDFVNTSDRAELLAHMRRILAGEDQQHHGEYRLSGRDGKELWTKLSFSVICDAEGRPVQLAIVEDITEEKRLSLALASSELRFARLRDSGLIGIYRRHRSGEITDANDAFLAMTGHVRDTLDRGALNASMLVAEESQLLEASVSAELERDGVSPARERVYVRKDGTKGVMLAGAVADGESVVGFTLDVTSIREAEHVRARSAHELEDSLRARDDFLALLAHELRNPLTPLTMQLTSLRAVAATAKDPLDPRWVDRHLATAQRAAVRLGRLVESLLDVSRATVGGFPLEREKVDLIALAKEVAERSRDDLERVHCSLTVNGNGYESIEGLWDRMVLERVLLHLLANAMKYGPRKPIEITVGSDGDFAVLTVRDHGIGIPEGEQRRIFDRFARVAPIQNYGGFGLGLWLVRRLAEAHGGSVEARQPDGEGAEISVRLPMAPMVTQDETKSGGSMGEVKAARPRVLVVDDDDDVRDILSMGLGGAGYDVHGSADGAEALEAISHEKPDIVLLDMMMPVMNGPEFLARVRADERYRDLPVLVVTAWPGEARNVEGANGVLAKPVDLGQLVRTIDRTLH